MRPRPESAQEPVQRKLGRPLRAATSEAILRVTARLLTEGGYGRLTIDRIAEQAGVSRNSILRRYPQKLDILVDFCRSINATELPLPDTGTIVGDLTAHFSTYIHNTAPSWRAGVVPAIIAESFNRPELASVLHDAYFLPRRERAAQIVKRAIARGELLPSVDAGVIVDIIAGFAWHRRLTGIEIDVGVTQRFIDTVLNGIMVAR